MIKGEETFIQAIRNIRTLGAIKEELMLLVVSEYARNPDLPPPVYPESEPLEDIKEEK